ncbi:lipoprotein insertase outer membrane protein LolB [Agarivorans sp. QJM3NY_33]|uniref:lipoprotein insertase outer membrane protein LolB n=1 Tax=Agarivorans sp. QJM3NY_33 TaxID=3421432 RepID=UPI003D7D2CFB
MQTFILQKKTGAIVRQFALFIVLAVSLSACTIQPPITTKNSEWDQHLSQLQQLTTWQLSGKIAFIGETSRQAANLSWQQDGEQSILKLNGPLGTQAIELHYQPHKVWVKTKNQEYFGDNAQQLIMQLTGWQVPIAQLPNWLLGIPTQNDYQLNPQHRLAAFTTADNWQVNYLNYAQYGQLALPRQLEIRSKSTLLKLNIHQWQIHD